MKRILPIFVLLGHSLSPGTAAHEHAASPPTLGVYEAMATWGLEAEKIQIETQLIDNGFYVLFGLGGNIAVFSGSDGVLLVDDQMPAIMPKLKEAMEQQGDRRIDFVINTHGHFDHSDGNKSLGAAEHTWFVAHKNARQMMMRENLVNLVSLVALQEPYPPEALPHITFDDAMQFHFNGEQIDVMHFGAAHTTGDAIVFFRERNTVHMGDVYSRAGYPFIDSGSGGTIMGVINSCRAVLALIDEDTVIIPGHGPLATRADLLAYTEMLEHVHNRLQDMMDNGKTLDEVLASRITKRWDEELGDPTMLLDRAYLSMKERSR